MPKHDFTPKQLDFINSALAYYLTVVEDEYDESGLDFDENYESDPAYIKMDKQRREIEEIQRIVLRKLNNKGENK
jgi:hypothetical protein